MVSKRDAVKKLIQVRTTIDPKAHIFPIVEKSGHMSMSVEYESAGLHTFTELFDPPKSKFDKGVVGYSNENLVQVVDCTSRGYIVKESTAPNVLSYTRKTFTPLPIYSELEKYKRALGLACKNLCEDLPHTSGSDEVCKGCPLGGCPTHCHGEEYKHVVSHFLNEADKEAI